MAAIFLALAESGGKPYRRALAGLVEALRSICLGSSAYLATQATLLTWFQCRCNASQGSLPHETRLKKLM
eukprot:4156832-Amphidinium_carterae.1